MNDRGFPDLVQRLSAAAAESGGALGREVRAYVRDVLQGMALLPDQVSARRIADDTVRSNEIFSVLTSRAFCYLGRNKTERFRENVVHLLRRRMATGGAFRFFYDVGPGYHATTRPGILPLSYDVGLSELLIVSQVSALCRRVAELYEPGARFLFVIDNLRGLRTNDIPLHLTEGYVRQFRWLIENVGMSNKVELIVESEEFDLKEYDRLLADVEVQTPDAEPSPEAIDNVARFLGYPCSAAEAVTRMERYRRTGTVTDTLIDRLVREVHMTQRATGATLGFRPFPGGDQRTQVGELALRHGSSGRLRPVLLTSRNVDDYDCTRLDLSDVLPAPMTHVTYASPRPRTRA